MTALEKWKRIALEDAAKYVITPIVALILAFILGHLRSRISSYGIFWLSILIVVLVTSAVWDIAIGWKSKNFKGLPLPYLLSVVAFILLTIWSGEQSVRSNAPIWASLIIFGFAKLSNLSGTQQKIVDEYRTQSRIGFAATGIVICESNRDDPTFILILNRNLRGGGGLWVPPGGHFTPNREDPLERLLTKVRREIGMQCTVIVPKGKVGHELGKLRTDRVKSLVPPAFLLEEDLMGHCSHGHEFHFDLVYLLSTDGVIADKDHKYATEQIRVPVSRCAGTFKDAEAAISAAIEGWYVGTSGSRPAIMDTLTSDVVWRLHLASQMRLDT
jgi:hypothetical protein